LSVEVASNESLAAVKRGLRAVATEARAEAHASLGDAAGARLARHGLGFLHLGLQRSVSGFMSFGTEIDVLPLMGRLAANGWRTAMPVIEAPRTPLAFRAWKPGDPMIPGVWNIPRPLDTAELVEPDVLLVPLLAFDRFGHRLGYGGGFYDRTLAKLRGTKPVVAVGIGFSAQEMAEIPCAPFDQPLDWILTENGPRRPDPGTPT
jgi:5-formyltetrahydrofolate cyclo-ligase